MDTRLIAGAIIEVAAAVMFGAGVVGMSIKPSNNPSAVFSIAVGVVLSAYSWTMIIRATGPADVEESELAATTNTDDATKPGDSKID